MTLATLTAAHGARLEAEHNARAKLVALALRHGIYCYATVRPWRYVGRLEQESLEWFERGRQKTVELHIHDSGTVWAEDGDSWRVLSEKEVRRLLFEGM